MDNLPQLLEEWQALYPLKPEDKQNYLRLLHPLFGRYGSNDSNHKSGYPF